MTPNAVIGKTEKPWSAEIIKALGPSAEIWKQFVGLAGVLEEWKCVSPKYLPATDFSARGLYHR
jgi:hypothetical protein